MLKQSKATYPQKLFNYDCDNAVSSVFTPPEEKIHFREKKFNFPSWPKIIIILCSWLVEFVKIITDDFLCDVQSYIYHYK